MPGSPVVVGYDGTPEATVLVRRAAARAAPGPVVVVHCWRSLADPHGVGVLLRGCAHPHTEAAMLRVARGHDAAERLAAARAVAAGVAVAQEMGARATGICAGVRGRRGVADTLAGVAREVGARGVVVGVRPRRGWRRWLRRRPTALTLARRLQVPVVAVPLLIQREENRYASCS